MSESLKARVERAERNREVKMSGQDNFFYKETAIIPSSDIHFEHAKLVVVWQALRTLKDNIEEQLSDKDDSILWGSIVLLEDILPRIMTIKETLENYVPREVRP